MSFLNNLFIPPPSGSTGATGATGTRGCGQSGNGYYIPGYGGPFPTPGSFDFAGQFRFTAFCFDNPLSPGGPVMVVGWNALVTIFSSAMSSDATQPGDWMDENFAANWLAVNAYNSWVWTAGSPPTPAKIRIPFAGQAAITLPEPFAAGGVITITAMSTTMQQAYQQFINLNPYAAPAILTNLPPEYFAN